MRFHRLIDFLILFIGTSGVTLLRLFDFLNPEFATEISEAALGGQQGKSPPFENVSYAFENEEELSYNGYDTQLLCSGEEIKNGTWEPITMEQPPYITKTEHLRCYPLSEYTSGEWKTYDWKPASHCKLTRWNRGQFCSLLRRATVMVIGDSLSWEHFSSMGQLLGMRIYQTTQHESKLYQQNYVKLACKNQVRLVFRRDDKLMNLTAAIESTFPQVLVMNRGAHYVNDTRLISEIQQNIKVLKIWKNRCREMGIKCHLFWRTSVPGHPLCDQKNYTQPINNLGAMESLIANRSNYNNRTIKYHWFDYRHQNELVLDMLYQELGDGELDLLDGYHINLLRPDEHRAHQGDCLHNCYPGKMDVYSQLMLHFLKMRRNRNDVNILVKLVEERNNRNQQPNVTSEKIV